MVLYYVIFCLFGGFLVWYSSVDIIFKRLIFDCLLLMLLLGRSLFMFFGKLVRDEKEKV